MADPTEPVALECGHRARLCVFVDRAWCPEHSQIVAASKERKS